MDATQFMGVDWLKKVCQTPENDVRAHQIALTYFHLAKHLDDLIHEHSPAGRAPNANWFNFGLWGTLSVSQNIGNNRPLQRLNSGAAMPLRRLVTPTVLNVKASRRQEVARALSWAQLLIFISSCTALRLFDENRDADEPFSAGQLLDGFKALGVSAAKSDPFGVSGERHATSVARAFRFYARARRAMVATGGPDPDQDALMKAMAVQAQFVLGANVLLTEIEQDIADPAVSVVLDLVPRRLGEAMDWRLAKLAQRFRGIPTHYSSLVLPFLHANERRAVDALWSRFMTDQVLVMALPTESLRVGRDIPPRRRDAPYFPADLLFPKNLNDLADRYWQCPHVAAPPTKKAKGKAASDAPARCADCESGFRDHLDVAERVRSLDRTVGDGRGSAARDWRRWDERMNWAVTMMRSRQHDDTLFWRPYSTRDEFRIIARDLPLRSGDASDHQVQAPALEGGPTDVNLHLRSDSK